MVETSQWWNLRNGETVPRVAVGVGGAVVSVGWSDRCLHTCQYLTIEGARPEIQLNKGVLSAIGLVPLGLSGVGGLGESGWVLVAGRGPLVGSV